MPRGFFVTGTDTGIGKTVVSALLCVGLDAVYWKPIQTGSIEGTDRATVTRLAGLAPGRALPEVYCFRPPVSPHLAARLAHTRIELGTIKMPKLARGGILIAEGAGGSLVPINHKQLMTDLMRHLRLPVVLVTRTTLGTINHTLLSLAALRAANLRIAGVVMCGPPDAENRKAIEHYGKIRVIGDLPRLKKLHRPALLAAFRKHFDQAAFGA